jgi:hypothetical protein
LRNLLSPVFRPKRNVHINLLSCNVKAADPGGRRVKNGQSPSEIVGSNPAGGIDVFLLWVLCVFRYRYLRWNDHSSRGVLPTVVRCCVWSRKLKNDEVMTRFGPKHHRKRK